MKVAILTGGGDCPGLNAVIRAVVRRGEQHGLEFTGVRDGWRGLLANDHFRLTRDAVSGILHLGGTILGTSRTNPFKSEGGPERVLETLERNHLQAVVAIGGEDTLGVAKKFFDMGVKVVGCPKTIDNDLSGTDYTFGFDTAVTIATEAIDRLHTTAEAHSRVIVCEVMGRHAGHIALHSGMAGGADVILIPERPIDLDEVAAHVLARQARGRRFSIVVVAEGAQIQRGKDEVQDRELDQFGHVRLGGIANVLAAEIEKRTGIETRTTVLGHIQRGGSPTARDRVLGTRYGVFAADLVRDRRFGQMAALRGDAIVGVSLEEATRDLHLVDPALYDVAAVFFG
ncbi:6-phosphofructokinase [Anaeromyxobacter paludicola]|uniref:Pyrophosphate--fructose 6-phosphate 1-phosphotransferase n=1 Tax=Anaeromyxobacter paludicola TaxID=2918171 RepID=A0ABM7XC87_9BACT|nr:6-phosphofructokinase [Anaeromyxobacter paludicola]BDG09474.1 pyrophosphate--fructose 6-phosphate 1-phosphotransferase [Anaeromyxobacter paludicola]